MTTRSLTYSERRVADHLATGATNAQIADALTVSVDTVKSHLQHIFRKLNVRTRTEAVIKLREAAAPAADAVVLARFLIAHERAEALAPIRALIDAAPDRPDCRYQVRGRRRVLIDLDELRRAVAEAEEASA